ncbi:MAG: type II toxin-antitoxin system HicB family antitoxin [Cyanobacteria bacterium]|nr:type II toxin-antitoxin system HicB family antitoxin [Cyanobacteriota bacterium]
MSRRKMANQPISYTVLFERDKDNWWTVSIPEIQGCRTQSKTIAQGMERIRDALSLVIDEKAFEVELKEKIILPAEIAAVCEEARQLEEQLACMQEMTARLKQIRKIAADAFADMGISRRDSGSILNLSHQRIQQLIQDDQ